jgi:hypothetical protein
MYHLDLIIDLVNQELVKSGTKTMIGMNLIVTQNNTIVTLHLDDEEHGSE